MHSYFRSSVVRVGCDAADMVEGGVMILFAEPVPEELAEVSVIHVPESDPDQEICEGDVVCIGGSTLTITAVGERAEANLRELGHIVIYANPGPGASLLPGAVQVLEELATPEPGCGFELRRGGQA